jgi:hypothetical protein
MHAAIHSCAGGAAGVALHGLHNSCPQEYQHKHNSCPKECQLYVLYTCTQPVRAYNTVCTQYMCTVCTLANSLIYTFLCRWCSWCSAARPGSTPQWPAWRSTCCGAGPGSWQATCTCWAAPHTWRTTAQHLKRAYRLARCHYHSCPSTSR